MKHVIEVIKGVASVNKICLTETEVLIGRGSQNELSLNDVTVSLIHARIIFKDSQYIIEDVGATNPVKVNEESITSHILNHGDLISVGHSIIKYSKAESEAALAIDPNRRDKSLLQTCTFVMVCFLIALQLIFLTFFSVGWRSSKEHHDTRARAKQFETILEINEKRGVLGTGKNKPSKQFDITEVESPESQAVEPDKSTVEKAKVPGKVKASPGKEINTLSRSPAEILALVENHIEKNNHSEAERTIHRLLKAYPDHLPAYAALAKLYQSRGDKKRAIKSWNEIVKRKHVDQMDIYFEAVSQKGELEKQVRFEAIAAQYETNTDEKQPIKEAIKPMLKKAETVLEKLDAKAPVLKTKSPVTEVRSADVISLATNPATEPRQTGPKETIVKTHGAATINITEITVQRYPKNERFEDMRLVSVELATENFNKAITGKDVRVKIIFYDQDEANGKIEVSQADVPEPEKRLEGSIQPAEKPLVSFAYVIKPGDREAYYKRWNRQLRYYGYVVKVYYQGHLVDIEAKPQALKNL